MQTGDVLILKRKGRVCGASLCIQTDECMQVMTIRNGTVQILGLGEQLGTGFVEWVMCNWSPNVRTRMRTLMLSLLDHAQQTPFDDWLLQHTSVSPNGAMELWLWQTMHRTAFLQMCFVAWVVCPPRFDWSICCGSRFEQWLTSYINESQRQSTHHAPRE
jgi:hypothetical protein